MTTKGKKSSHRDDANTALETFDRDNEMAGPRGSRTIASTRSSRIADMIADKVLCILIEHKTPPGCAASELTDEIAGELVAERGNDWASESARVAAEESSTTSVSGRVGAVVHTQKNNVEVKVPLPVVHGVLKLTRFLPQSLRDKALDLLASRGIALERGEGIEADERLIEQISKLNVDISTEKIRVKVCSE